MQFRLRKFLFWSIVVGASVGFLTPYVRGFLMNHRRSQFRNAPGRARIQVELPAVNDSGPNWRVYESSETPLD